MRFFLKFFLILFLIFLYSGCVSETKKILNEKKTDDIQMLLEKLVEKEKEINELNKKLEFYEKNKTNK